MQWSDKLRKTQQHSAIPPAHEHKINYRSTSHRSDTRLEAGMCIRRRLRHRCRRLESGGAIIDLVGVSDELLPRDYGSFTWPEVHRKHLPVAGLDEWRRRPRRFAPTGAILVLHGFRRIFSRAIKIRVPEWGKKKVEIEEEKLIKEIRVLCPGR